MAVGRIGLRVVPDTKGFWKTAAAELKSAAPTGIEVKVKAKTDKFSVKKSVEEIEALLKDAAEVKVKPTVDKTALFESKAQLKAFRDDMKKAFDKEVEQVVSVRLGKVNLAELNRELNRVRSQMTGGWSKLDIGSNISQAVEKAAVRISSAAENANAIIDKHISDAATRRLQGLRKAIPNLIGSIPRAVGVVARKTKTALGLIAKDFTSLGNRVLDALGPVGWALRKIGAGVAYVAKPFVFLGKAIGQTVRDLGYLVWSGLAELPSRIASFVSSAISFVGSAARAMFVSFPKALGEAFVGVSREMIAWTKNFVGGAFSRVWNSTLGTTLRSGISRALSSVKDFGVKVAVGIKNLELVQGLARNAAMVKAWASNTKAKVKAYLDSTSLKREMAIAKAMVGKITAPIRMKIHDAAAKVGLIKLGAWVKAKTKSLASKIRVRVDPDLSRLATVRKAITGIGKHLKDAGSFNLPQMPSMGLFTAAILAASTALVAFLPQLGSLGASILSMLPAVGLLPGAFLGAAAAGGVLFMAFKDVKDVFADLGPAFKEVQRTVSDGFWEQAAAPIRELTNTHLPAAKAGLADLASTMGKLTVSGLSSLFSTFDIGSFLESTNKAFQSVQGGINALMRAFGRLAMVAAPFGETLGRAFTNAMEKFDAFIARAQNSGSLTQAFDTALKSISDFGRLIIEVGAMFGNFFSASEATTSLGSLADAFHRINQAIGEGGSSRETVETFFRAMQETTSNLGPGFEALGPVIKEFVNGLDRVLPAGAKAFSAIVETLSPAISALIPPISSAVEALLNFAAANPIVAVAIAGLTSGIAVLTPVISRVASFVGALQGIGALFAEGGLLAGLGPTLAAAAAPALVIVGALAALAAALVHAWNTSSTFRDAVSGLWQAIQNAAAPVIAFIQGTVVPVVMQIVNNVMVGLRQIGDALTPLFTVIVQIATAIITLLTPVITFLMSVFAPVFTWLGDVISLAWIAISSVISAAINIITGILQAGLAILRGDWSGAWDAIKNMVSNVWNNIKSILAAGVGIIMSTISNGMNVISNIVRGVWSGITAVFSGAWGTIKGVVSSGANFLNDLMGGLPGRLLAPFSGIASRFNSIGSDMIQGMINGVQNMIGGLLGAVRDAAGSALNAAKSLLGIHSPSRKFRYLGEMSGIGLALGMEDEIARIERASANLTVAATPDIPQSQVAGIGSNRLPENALLRFTAYDRVFETVVGIGINKNASARNHEFGMAGIG